MDPLSSFTAQRLLPYPPSKLKSFHVHLANEICSRLGLKDLLNLRLVCKWTFPSCTLITIAKHFGSKTEDLSETEAVEYIGDQCIGILCLDSSAQVRDDDGKINFFKTLARIRKVEESAFSNIIFPLSSFSHTVREIRFLSQFDCYPKKVCSKKGTTPLESAVENQDPEAVKLLLELYGKSYVKTKTMQGDNATPMHAAAKTGNVHIMGLLVEHYGSGIVNIPCSATEITPLHLAAESNNPEAVLYLLEKGAKFHAQDERGNTCMHYVARTRNVHVMAALINGVRLKGYSPSFLKYFLTLTNKDNETALEFAVSPLKKSDSSSRQPTDQIACIELLLSNGVPWPAHLYQCGRILIAAAANGNAEILRLFLDRLPSLLTLEFPDLQSLLHTAIAFKNTEAVEILLQYGAPIWMQEKTRGRTPLHLAVEIGVVDIACILLEHAKHIYGDGSDFQMWISARDSFGDTALATVIGNRSIDESSRHYILEMLLAYGADPNIAASTNELKSFIQPPLNKAIKNGSQIESTLLLEYGANPNTVSTDQNTSLHMASKTHCSAVVQKLFEHGAFPNEKNLYRESPLHLAASTVPSDHENFIKTFQLLLENGADPNGENLEQQTPLHYLTKLKLPKNHTNRNRSRIEAIRMLLEKGAIGILTDKHGKTPVQYASETIDSVALKKLFFPSSIPVA